MRKRVICLVGCAILLAALPAAAQMGNGDIVKVYFVKPKSGMEAQFEEAFKKHIQWHREQKDTWTYLTWQVIVGEGNGSYGVGTFNHKWEDFDKPGVDPAADAAHAVATIGPTVERVTPTFWRFMKDVSHPVAAGTEPPGMWQVLTFQLKHGQAAHFNHLIKKFHEAIQKTKWPVNYEWYELLVGGEHPTYVIVLPRSNWAAFKPMDKPFPVMLEEAVGRMEAQHMLEAFGKTIQREWSEVIRSRPDLGYTPAK